MSRILISIIVPVHNVEDYIGECIESILGQTFEGAMEVIIVDDGSTDKSGAICDAYAKSDSRVVVIHEENQGCWNARNKGVEKAKGEYIGFVDGDDVIHPRMYEILYEMLKNSNCPFVHCGFKRFNDSEIHTLWEEGGREYPSQMLTAEQGAYRLLESDSYGHYIWKGLYKATLVRELPFPEIRGGGDMIWSSMLMTKISGFLYSPVVLYGYRQRMNSIVHDKDIQMLRVFIEASYASSVILRTYFPAMSAEVVTWLLHFYIGMYNEGASMGEKERISLRNEISGFWKKVDWTIWDILSSHKMPWYRKVFMMGLKMDFCKTMNCRNWVIRHFLS